MKKIVWLLSILAIVLAGCSSIGKEAIYVSPELGAKAPDFTLNSLDGKEVQLADYEGQVVLVNFWATWCPPCVYEMPTLQERYADTDLVVLAVDYGEEEELVRFFAESMDLTFPVLLDPTTDVQKLYQVRGYPTSFFLDEEGVIQIIHIGGMQESQVDSYLKEMGITY